MKNEENLAQLPALLSQANTGVSLGILIGFDESGRPLISRIGSSTEKLLPALSTVALDASDTGSQVAILFFDGDRDRPLIIGLVVPSNVNAKGQVAASKSAEKELPVLSLEAGSALELRCGKASLALTKEGRIVLRGTEILSRSSGSNKIKGGSVQIN